MQCSIDVRKRINAIRSVVLLSFLQSFVRDYARNVRRVAFNDVVLWLPLAAFCFCIFTIYRSQDWVVGAKHRELCLPTLWGLGAAEGHRTGFAVAAALIFRIAGAST